MVEELVREFVPEALATGLDFSGLRRVNPKFHSGRRSARRREGDVIWRLPTCEGTDIYLYLLIEFQSTSDWWMPVRTQVYQGLLWQQVIDEKKLKAGARLPPLLLLVLYNGIQRWKAPTDIRDLIALSPDSALWPWQPQIRYYLLDMGAFPRDDLTRRTSVAALLFRLEQPLSSQDLKELVGEVVGWVRRHPDYADLRRLFTELVRRAFIGLGVTRPIPEDLLEMKTNLERLGKVWKRQWRAEVKAEVRAKVRAEGKAEGKAEALVCLLAERFGTVRPSLRKRILGANLATLECWFKRAIIAPDLPSVFDHAS
jgi:Putative transposase, YhgA-like